MDTNNEMKDNELTLKKKKSKGKVIGAIIGIVLLIAACVAAYFIFFYKDIKGSWCMVNSQSVKQILTFKDNNSLMYTQGSLILETTYTLDGNKVKLDLSKDETNEDIVEYTYDIDGFFTNKRLFLKDSEGKVEEYDQCEEFKVNPPSEFNLVESLVGEWKNEEFDISYHFNNDGTAFLTRGKLKLAFVYTADDSKIAITVNNGQTESTARTSQVNYIIKDGNKLEMSGIEYIKQ